MKKLLLAFLVMTMTLTAFSDEAEQDQDMSQPLHYRNKFYIILMYANIGGIPISYNKFDTSHMTVPADIGTAKSSAYSPVIGIGYTFSGQNKLLWEVELEYAGASFSDWRVHNRKISFFMFLVNLGTFFSKNPLVIGYLAAGGGVVAQSDFVKFSLYNENWMFENMQKTELPVFLGFGLKYRPISPIMLRAEFKFYWKLMVGGSPNVIYEGTAPTSSSEVIGSRLAIGLEYRFGKK